jgi:hypothetical protein
MTAVRWWIPHVLEGGLLEGMHLFSDRVGALEMLSSLKLQLLELLRVIRVAVPGRGSDDSVPCLILHGR